MYTNLSVLQVLAFVTEGARQRKGCRSGYDQVSTKSDIEAAPLVDNAHSYTTSVDTGTHVCVNCPSELSPLLGQ